MSNTKFITENGLLVKGGQSIFQQQVIVGNTEYDRVTNPALGSNLYVYGDLLYVGGNLHVIGNTNVQGTTAYETDFIPTTSGLKLGNETYRFNGYFDNTYVYAGLYPSSNTILFGNTSKRWVISANTIDVSGNIKISTIGTGNGSFYNSSVIMVGNNTSNVDIEGSGITSSGSSGINPFSNTVGTTLGTATQRWVFNANTGNFSGLITGLAGATFTGTVNASASIFVGGGVATTNGASITNTNISVGNTDTNVAISTTGIVSGGGTGVNPVSNTKGTALGTNTQRWVFNANTGNFSGLITGSAGATFGGTVNVASVINVADGLGTTNGVSITDTAIAVGNSTVNVVMNTTGLVNRGGTGVRPASNTVGSNLGTTTQRWELMANTGDFSGQITGSSGANITGTVNASASMGVGTIGVSTNGVSITNTQIRIGNSSVSTNIGPGTIAGSMNFDAGTLVVDATNDRVGIACSSPSNTFNVQGTVGISGVTTIGANLAVSGISHTISGNSNFAGGGLFVDSVNARIGIGTTTPDARFQVAGAANITGATTLGGTLTVSGIATFNANSNFDAGVLFVDGTNNRVGINNTAPGVALRVTGDVDVSATSNLRGAATLGGTLSVAGAANALSTLGITGAVNALSTLGVGGLLTGSGGAVFTGTINTTASILVGGGVATTNGTTITNTSISVGNTDTNVAVSTTGIISGGGTGINPVSNTKGTALGTTTRRWNVTANTGDFSGTLTAANFSGNGTGLTSTTYVTRYELNTDTPIFAGGDEATWKVGGTYTPTIDVGVNTLDIQLYTELYLKQFSDNASSGADISNGSANVGNFDVGGGGGNPLMRYRITKTYSGGNTTIFTSEYITLSAAGTFAAQLNTIRDTTPTPGNGSTYRVEYQWIKVDSISVANAGTVTITNSNTTQTNATMTGTGTEFQAWINPRNTITIANSTGGYGTGAVTVSVAAVRGPSSLLLQTPQANVPGRNYRINDPSANVQLDQSTLVLNMVGYK